MSLSRAYSFNGMVRKARTITMQPLPTVTPNELSAMLQWANAAENMVLTHTPRNSEELIRTVLKHYGSVSRFMYVRYSHFK